MQTGAQPQQRQTRGARVSAPEIGGPVGTGPEGFEGATPPVWLRTHAAVAAGLGRSCARVRCGLGGGPRGQVERGTVGRKRSEIDAMDGVWNECPYDGDQVGDGLDRRSLVLGQGTKARIGRAA